MYVSIYVFLEKLTLILKFIWKCKGPRLVKQFGKGQSWRTSGPTHAWMTAFIYFYKGIKQFCGGRTVFSIMLLALSDICLLKRELATYTKMNLCHTQNSKWI